MPSDRRDQSNDICCHALTQKHGMITIRILLTCRGDVYWHPQTSKIHTTPSKETEVLSGTPEQSARCSHSLIPGIWCVQNEMQFLRIKSLKHEVIVAPSKSHQHHTRKRNNMWLACALKHQLVTLSFCCALPRTIQRMINKDFTQFTADAEFVLIVIQASNTESI